MACIHTIGPIHVASLHSATFVNCQYLRGRFIRTLGQLLVSLLSLSIASVQHCICAFVRQNQVYRVHAVHISCLRRSNKFKCYCWTARIEHAATCRCRVRTMSQRQCMFILPVQKFTDWRTYNRTALHYICISDGVNKVVILRHMHARYSAMQCAIGHVGFKWESLDFGPCAPHIGIVQCNVLWVM